MTKIVNIADRGASDREGIEAEAAAWVVQADGGPLADEELREFREWLRRSPLHRQAFHRAASAWNDLDVLSDLFTAAGEERPASRSGHGLRRARLAVLGMLAALGLIAGTAGLLLVPEQQNADITTEYHTPIGGVQAIDLPDGSSVRLNTDSALSVAYGKAARTLRLTEGEAYFSVRHDPDRPFVVYAGRFAVRAVGTAFSVQVIEDRVDLTVTDGRVEVAAFEQADVRLAALDTKRIEHAASRVPLVAGQHVVFNEANQQLELVQRIAPEEIEKKLSWRDGMLIFDNDPLTDVVSELNRYTPAKIVISDASIRDLRFGGYFRAGDIASIMSTLEEGFGIRVEKISDELIYLSRQRNTR